ncbi:hypothetical protein ACFRLW_10390 [Streptomyces sp. NPDC056728]|uniref:hypothetical protein n=1 Tax=Paenibacillus chitinolyticus TaxID=79263 RepID=UPI00366D704D
MSEQSSAADALYTDAEHFTLTSESRPPLKPREHVRSAGRPFPGLLPDAGTVRPAEEPAA